MVLATWDSSCDRHLLIFLTGCWLGRAPSFGLGWSFLAHSHSHSQNVAESWWQWKVMLLPAPGWQQSRNLVHFSCHLYINSWVQLQHLGMNTYSVPSTLLHSIFSKFSCCFDRFYRRACLKFYMPNWDNSFNEVVTDLQPQKYKAHRHLNSLAKMKRFFTYELFRVQVEHELLQKAFRKLLNWRKSLICLNSLCTWSYYSSYHFSTCGRYLFTYFLSRW